MSEMEKIAVVQDQTPPFAREGKFHVKLVEGRFQNLRRLSSWPLILAFFATVWIQVEGQPWVLFSFEQRSIFLFGLNLSWHDLPLLAGLMITGGALLFFMAVGWGRVWCGFACPQSIWTWIFIRIEEWAEGRVNERVKSDTQLFTLKRLMRRLLKHLLWMLVATATAITFTGYFIPIREILTAAISLQISAALSGWIIIMAALTYLNAGLVREKICLHACPYSRFQGVMFDRNTRTVSYDAQRGNPRSNRRATDAGSGDCVDCGLCVQVCPTGIDIRDGLQAACIDCGACIDACDAVMEKLSLPKGLIRFASEHELNKQPQSTLRPRLMGYVVVMLCALGAFLYGISDTTQLLVEIRRDRMHLFTQMDDKEVCNNYLVKVESFDKALRQTEVSVSGLGAFELYGNTTIDLSESSSTWLPYRVCASGVEQPRSNIMFRFSATDAPVQKITTFLTRTI